MSDSFPGDVDQKPMVNNKSGGNSESQSKTIMTKYCSQLKGESLVCQSSLLTVDYHNKSDPVR